MHLPSLLSLPPAIILLLCATPAFAEPAWPHNLPKHMKYFPEEEAHVRRGLDIREKLRNEKPIGMRKKSLDEGEMFVLDDWIFASDTDRNSEPRNLHNQTIPASSPLRPLAEEEWFGRFRVRDILLKRQFKCPSGTNDCSSVGAPDVCCGSGSDCVTVPDSSIGSIGCCPSGQMCAGTITCDEANGYSSCPDAPNGGCCLPGFRCDGIGCVAAGTSAIYVLPSTSARPSTSTAVGAPTSASTSATLTSTKLSSSTSAYTCSTGWYSCPVSLGGGCCQTGRECASGASCIGDEPTSTQAPEAPIRPTSQAVTTTTAASDDGGFCPGGFYACKAYYPSGCCRIGRDCQTTGSCTLPPYSTTVIETNGVVIVAPSGASVATPAPEGGSCPNSWYRCPADKGGDCCPEGFACGEQCTATAAGVSSVEAKVAPSTASFVSQWSIWGMVCAAFAAGIAMIAL